MQSVIDSTLSALKISFENSKTPFFIFDFDFKLLYKNSAFETTFPEFSSLYSLFKDADTTAIKNYLLSDKSYTLHATRGDGEDISFSLSTVFENDKPLFVTAVYSGEYTKSSLLENTLIEPQEKIEQELRDRLSILFTSIYGLCHSEGFDPTDNACTYINSINQNCFQMLRAVDNLTKMSLLNSKNDHINTVSVDLIWFIKRLVDSIKTLDNKMNTSIEFKCSERSLHVLIDIVRIEFIIANLILNSAKYGAKNVEISAQKLSSNVVVTVSDDGAGIPKNVLKKIGTPFYSYSHDGKYQSGFGIALYICKKYISSLGGSFNITSKEGEGTTVSFSLPLEKKDEDVFSDFLSLSSPPEINDPLSKFSQTRLQLSDICYYPVI